MGSPLSIVFEHASRGLVAMAFSMLFVACSSSSDSDISATVEKHLKAGNPGAATIELKSHLATHPDSPQARYLLGKVLNTMGDFNAAAVELRKALELKQPANDVLPELARVMLASGLNAKVISEFGKLTLTDPGADADLLTSVGIAYSRTEKNDLAAATFAKALSRDPKFLTAKLASARLKATTKDAPAALLLVDEVLAVDSNMAEAWLARGDVLLYGQNDLEGAIVAYGRAVDAKPGMVRAHLSRIDIYMFQRDVDSVRRQYEALRKASPAGIATKLVEAQLAYLDNDFQSAKSLIQPLLRILPDNIQILILDGAVSMQLKAYLQAEASFAKAVQLFPTATLARKLLAQTHLLLGQPSTALADMASMIESPSVDSTTLSLAAEAQLQVGNLDKADEYFRRAVSVNPADVGVRTSAALARLARGDVVHAFSELNLLTDSDKGTTADLALISAYMKRGELALAFKAVEKLQLKLPDKPLPADLAGRIQLAKNDKVAARASFEKALALDAAYFPAATSLAQLDVLDKDVPSARLRYETLLKKNPRSSDARMALIELKIFEKAPKGEVAKLLTELIGADRAYIPARLKLIDLHLANKAPGAAVSVAQDAATAFPAVPEYLNALGRAQISASELEQARASFTKLASLLPNRVSPLMQIADVQVMQGNSAGAMVTLRRALDFAPGDVEVNRRLMALAISSKQPEKAIGFAREMQRRQPKAALGYVFEAEIEATRKNWTGTISALRTGISNAPEQAAPIAAKLYIAYISAGRTADAEMFSTNWLKEHPGDSSFPTRLGDFLLMRQDWPGAERQYLAVLKIDPKSVSALNNVAWLLVKQGKGGASAFSQRAVALAPSSLPILDTHALALAADGKAGEAVEISKGVVAKSPNANAFRLTLAKVYLKAGKAELARPELERLSTIGSKFNESAEAKQLLASLGGK